MLLGNEDFVNMLAKIRLSLRTMWFKPENTHYSYHLGMVKDERL
jgi:hypothetical protein